MWPNLNFEPISAPPPPPPLAHCCDIFPCYLLTKYGQSMQRPKEKQQRLLSSAINYPFPPPRSWDSLKKFCCRFLIVLKYIGILGVYFCMARVFPIPLISGNIFMREYRTFRIVGSDSYGRHA